MALELGGERLRPRARAQHQDEPQVVALPAVSLEHVPEHGPDDDRDDRLGREQDEQQGAG